MIYWNGLLMLSLSPSLDRWETKVLRESGIFSGLRG